MKANSEILPGQLTRSSEKRSKRKGEDSLILVDTGVLYAFADKKDELNLDAKAIMFSIVRGDFGSPIIVDYVIVETLLLLKARGIYEVARPLSEFLRINRFKIFFVTQKIFDESVELATKKGGEDDLSLTDSVEVIVSKNFESRTIATFDHTLSNFFQATIGMGFFEHLPESEQRALRKGQAKY